MTRSTRGKSIRPGKAGAWVALLAACFLSAPAVNASTVDVVRVGDPANVIWSSTGTFNMSLILTDDNVHGSTAFVIDILPGTNAEFWQWSVLNSGAESIYGVRMTFLEVGDWGGFLSHQVSASPSGEYGSRIWTTSYNPAGGEAATESIMQPGWPMIPGVSMTFGNGLRHSATTMASFGSPYPLMVETADTNGNFAYDRFENPALLPTPIPPAVWLFGSGLLGLLGLGRWPRA